MSKSESLFKNLKYESTEVKNMLQEMAKDSMRSDNNMISFCIKHYYENVFKK